MMLGLVAEEQGLNFLLNLMILGMAAFFTGAVKAPVTGIILIREMSGNFIHLGSLVLVCFTRFVVSELIASRPVYTVLLDRLVKTKVGDPLVRSDGLSPGPGSPLG
jgi:H+/Cl- antiporter ClcA